VRKKVRQVLVATLGREVKFSVHRVGFQDLARLDAYFVKLGDVSAAERQLASSALQRLGTPEYRVLLDTC